MPSFAWNYFAFPFTDSWDRPVSREKTLCLSTSDCNLVFWYFSLIIRINSLFVYSVLRSKSFSTLLNNFSKVNSPLYSNLISNKRNLSLSYSVAILPFKMALRIKLKLKTFPYLKNFWNFCRIDSISSLVILSWSVEYGKIYKWCTSFLWVTFPPKQPIKSACYR